MMKIKKNRMKKLKKLKLLYKFKSLSYNIQYSVSNKPKSNSNSK